ncbi:hypothetical protein G6Z86_07210 (plasmid) [Lactobacillus iners]|uniref:hypothetical protein n=1 Tax=Lactobacillus iners TaxID=147802 RepID=UPI0013E1194C|nr:hypothetical protein [Lactobacillus iners]QIH28354.1 hypothetical protein G6Z86_07210 [Lactobacillus iners]
MITGKRFENQLIAAKEAEYLHCYYNSDNFLLSDALNTIQLFLKLFEVARRPSFQKTGFCSKRKNIYIRR